MCQCENVQMGSPDFGQFLSIRKLILIRFIIGFEALKSVFNLHICQFSHLLIFTLTNYE
jgi:hypothetical protein